MDSATNADRADLRGTRRAAHPAGRGVHPGAAQHEPEAARASKRRGRCRRNVMLVLQIHLASLASRSPSARSLPRPATARTASTAAAATTPRDAMPSARGSSRGSAGNTTAAQRWPLPRCWCRPLPGWFHVGGIISMPPCIGVGRVRVGCRSPAARACSALRSAGSSFAHSVRRATPRWRKASGEPVEQSPPMWSAATGWSFPCPPRTSRTPSMSLPPQGEGRRAPRRPSAPRAPRAPAHFLAVGTVRCVCGSCGGPVMHHHGQTASPLGPCQRERKRSTSSLRLFSECSASRSLRRSTYTWSSASPRKPPGSW